MSWPRFLWLPLVLCVASLTLVPLAFPSSPAAALPPPPSEADNGRNDPAAARTIDQATALLHPDRVAWLEMSFWSRVTTEGLHYEASGHFLSSPDQRFHINMETRVGGTRGYHCLLGDGKTLWKATRFTDGPWTAISRLDLPAVLAGVGPSVHPFHVRDEFMECPSCGGVYSVLENMRRRLRWVRQETIHRNGRDLLQVMATWNAEAVQAMNAGAGAWPENLPRRCRLDLDAGTLWPERIEWWGPSSGEKAETLLAQLEYREPKINRPPPAERCVREFGFDPGTTPVVDRTQTVLERLRTAPKP